MRNTVQIGNIEMNYCMFGQGEQVFVILPGLSMYPVTPLETAVAARFSGIAEDHRVFLFDRRSNPPQTYGTGEMAEDTYCVMKYLGLDGISLYGASQGGMIALEIAAAHPAFVKNLIVGSTAASPNPTSRKVFDEWISLAMQRNMKELAASFTDHVYSKKHAGMYRMALSAVFEKAEDRDIEQFITMAAPVPVFDISDRLNRITANLFVIGCSGDRVLTGQASEKIAEITGAELFMYGDQYGHAAYDEAPDYTDRIREFLLLHNG